MITLLAYEKYWRSIGIEYANFNHLYLNSLFSTDQQSLNKKQD